MKTLKTLLGCFILIFLSGCSVRHVNETPQNASVSDPTLERQDAKKQETQKEDFIIGFNPLRDDPDNPSPHNPLVKKFGDIVEVRTYIRLQQKLHNDGLTLDESIELKKAEVHLYPSDAGKAGLKDLIKEKERYQRLGIDMSGIVLSIAEEENEEKEKKIRINLRP